MFSLTACTAAVIASRDNNIVTSLEENRVHKVELHQGAFTTSASIKASPLNAEEHTAWAHPIPIVLKCQQFITRIYCSLFDEDEKKIFKILSRSRVDWAGYSPTYSAIL